MTAASNASSLWARLLEAMTRRRRLDQARRDLGLLDARTLRDLGLCRSEFDSFVCEDEHWVERTRQRMAGSLRTTR